jgi:hypothetical protein
MRRLNLLLAEVDVVAQGVALVRDLAVEDAAVAVPALGRGGDIKIYDT